MIINLIKSEERCETEINIRYFDLDSETVDIINFLNQRSKKILGTDRGETFILSLDDIIFFETVDGKLFGYTGENCYQISEKLYRIEEKLQYSSFSRISKSVIANLSRMQSIKTEKNGRYTASMDNGERLLVSRKYIQQIKKKLGV